MTRQPWQTPPALIVLSILALHSPLFSLDAAAQWSEPTNLSASDVDSEDASIAVATDGSIHVVWTEGGEIWHRAHTGDRWSPPGYVTTGFSPQIVADEDGSVHMVFVDRFNDIDDVYYVSWQPDTGWDLPVNVCETACDSSAPQLAIAPDGSYAVVWSETTVEADQVYMGRSEDGGWWSVAPIPDAQGTRPVLGFTAAGDLWVVWQAWHDTGPGSDVLASERTGGEWTQPELISASPEVPSVFPSLVIWQEDACLAWQEGEPGTEAVYTATMTDGEWSTAEKRSGSAPACAPRLALDTAGQVHLVWNTQDTVKHTTCALPTANWQPSTTVTSGQTKACGAAVAVQQGALHVIWLAEASPDVRDVYYSDTASPGPTLTPTPSPTSSPPPPPTRTPTITPTVPAWKLFLPIIVASFPMMP